MSGTVRGGNAFRALRSDACMEKLCIKRPSCVEGFKVVIDW